MKPRIRIIIPKEDGKDVQFPTLPKSLLETMLEYGMNGGKEHWRKLGKGRDLACSTRKEETPKKKPKKKPRKKPRKTIWVKVDKKLATKLEINYYSLLDLILENRVRHKFDKWDNKVVHHSDLLREIGKDK